MICHFSPERVSQYADVPLESSLALSTNGQISYHQVLLHACHIYYALDDYE